MDKELTKICESYGLNLIIIESGDVHCEANGEEQYINNSYVAGNDIYLGMYEDKDIRVASMFHEIGHTKIEHSWMESINFDTVVIETEAWRLGLKEAEKFGHGINPSGDEHIFEYIVTCLQTYKNTQERV